MPSKNKAGFGLSGLSFLLLLFFAAPWLTVSCSGHDLLNQNGYQVIVGAASPPDDADKKAPNKEIEKEKAKGESIAAWWLALVPLAAIIAGLAGYRFATGHAAMWRLALGASAVAAVVMTIALVVRFPIEHKVEDMKAEMKADEKKGGDADPFKGLSDAIGNAMLVKRHNGIWCSVIAAWAMVGVSIFLQRASKT